MRLFAIDKDDTITAFPAAEQIPEGQEQFANEKELAKLAANWTADRLIQIWNSFAGVAGFGADLKPVKKFTDRKTAVKRIWAAVQQLGEAQEMEEQRTRIRDAETKLKAARAKVDAPAAPQVADVAPKGKRSRKAAKAKDAAPTAREGSKKAIVIELLNRPKGATLKDIMNATDWQAHSVRGFISGSLIKKMGLKVESAKQDDGDRTYHIVS